METQCRFLLILEQENKAVSLLSRLIWPDWRVFWHFSAFRFVRRRLRGEKQQCASDPISSSCPCANSTLADSHPTSSPNLKSGPEKRPFRLFAQFSTISLLWTMPLAKLGVPVIFILWPTLLTVVTHVGQSWKFWTGVKSVQFQSGLVPWSGKAQGLCKQPFSAKWTEVDSKPVCGKKKAGSSCFRDFLGLIREGLSGFPHLDLHYSLSPTLSLLAYTPVHCKWIPRHTQTPWSSTSNRLILLDLTECWMERALISVLHLFVSPDHKCTQFPQHSGMLNTYLLKKQWYHPSWRLLSGGCSFICFPDTMKKGGHCPCSLLLLLDHSSSLIKTNKTPITATLLSSLWHHNHPPSSTAFVRQVLPHLTWTLISPGSDSSLW